MKSHKRGCFLLYLWKICNRCRQPSWCSDTYHLFRCLRAIIPVPYNWEAQRRGSTRRSLIVVLRLLRLDQMGSWDLDELVAMTAATLLLSCLFPHWGPELTGSPCVSMSSLKVVWHLLNVAAALAGCVIHLQWRPVVWHPLISSTGAPARLWYWEANAKLSRSDPSEGLWSLGEVYWFGVFLFLFFTESGI